MLGLYRPGHSLVHRLSAGLKLITLALALVGVAWLDGFVALAAMGATVFALYALAGFTPALALRQVRPMLWFCVFIAAAQVVFASWQAALAVVGSLLISVALAALVTLTTRTTDLLTALERGLRPLSFVGVDPTRVSLVLAVAIRAVPVMADLAHRTFDAQRARGLRPSPRTLAVPMVVGTLRYSQAMGEALAARGLDDPQ